MFLWFNTNRLPSIQLITPINRSDPFHTHLEGPLQHHMQGLYNQANSVRQTDLFLSHNK